MAKVEIEVPDNLTILSGYFVYDAINDEGERFHGGTEYQDYDGPRTIGLLTILRQELVARELQDPEE